MLLGRVRQLPEERQHLYNRRPSSRITEAEMLRPRTRVRRKSLKRNPKEGAGRHGSFTSGMDVPHWPPEKLEELPRSSKDQM